MISLLRFLHSLESSSHDIINRKLRPTSNGKKRGCSFLVRKPVTSNNQGRMKCKLLTSQNVVENRSPICRPRKHDSSTWGGLLLLENDCVHRDANADANCSQHGKSRFQPLMLHPVQVVHVLGMEVVWLIMAVPSHSLHTSGMESTRSWCMHKEMKISNQGVIIAEIAKWVHNFIS